LKCRGIKRVEVEVEYMNKNKEKLEARGLR